MTCPLVGCRYSCTWAAGSRTKGSAAAPTSTVAAARCCSEMPADQKTWQFDCLSHSTVTRTEMPSSAAVAEVRPGQSVAVSRLVDVPELSFRRLFLPEHGGWVSEVDEAGRVLFKLRDLPLQLDALSTRQSLLAFSDGVDVTENLSSRSKTCSVDLFGLPQAYRQPPCLLEQRAVATEALANFVDTHGEVALLSVHPSTELRNLVRDHGVAPARRRRLWMAWAGATAMKEARPDGYAALLLKPVDKDSSDQIESDLPRTCPSVSWFSSSNGTDADGIAAMRRVLRAFTVDNPTVGYTQSLNFLAAFILLVFQTDQLRPGAQRAAEAEEDCFWLLTALTRRLLRGYHTENMRVVRIDARVFDALIEAKLPKLAAHLASHNIHSLDFISARWFLCCFHGILPAEAVARVFDNMMLARHNAPSVLLRVGLAVLRRASPRLLACDCDALLMEQLLHSPEGIRTAADIDALFHSAWNQIGRMPSARAMRESLADAQQEEELKRWASPAQDLPSGIESCLEQPFAPSNIDPSVMSSAAATTCNEHRYPRHNLRGTGAISGKITRRRSRARVWDNAASAALAKAASTLGVGGMESWLAVEGEGAPAPPLARALSDRDGNKPLERRLPCPTPVGAAGLNRTHSGARRAFTSARKLQTACNSTQEWERESLAKTGRKRGMEEESQDGIELTDLRGLSAGKKLRILCEDS